MSSMSDSPEIVPSSSSLCASAALERNLGDHIPRVEFVLVIRHRGDIFLDQRELSPVRLGRQFLNVRLTENETVPS